MPCAKFRADPLKTVGMHNEEKIKKTLQRNYTLPSLPSTVIHTTLVHDKCGSRKKQTYITKHKLNK